MNTEVIDRPATVPTTALTEQASTEVSALALITLSPEKYAAEVYQPFKTTLASAIDSVRAVEYDITTTAGMASAIKCRALFRDMRVAADKERKARKEPITKIGKLLESGFDQVEERIAPLELMFDAEITTENARKEAEKAAKIAAERALMAAIETRIGVIRDVPLHCATSSSEGIAGMMTTLSDMDLTAELFGDRLNDAVELRVATLARLAEMRDEKAKAEAAAHAAEQARIAEAARVEAERAENARQKAENERIANEQAAERDAMTERMRIERQIAADAQAKASAELKAQQDKLDAQQAAADARDAAALAAQQDAQRRDDDHGPALEMNAIFDAAIVACAKFPDVLAEQVAEEAEINADRARCTETANAMLTNGRSQGMSIQELADSIGDGDPDSEPTDIEIIDVYVENFGGTRAQAVARLLAFVGEGAAA